MRGVSSAAAAVIIATISISLVGTTYFLSRGMLESTTAEVFEVIDVFGNKLIIKNLGTQTITELKILVDGQQVDYSMDDIQPSKIGTVTIDTIGIEPGIHDLTIASKSMSQTFKWNFVYVVLGETTTTTTVETTSTTTTTIITEGQSLELSMDIEQGIAEIGKPVKWSSKIEVNNPSDGVVKDYIVNILIPEDASNITIEDPEEEVVTKGEKSVKVSIAGKTSKSYFVDYETPAPYKEERIIEPLTIGKKYIKRIAVKSDFTGYYENLGTYTETDTSYYENVKAYTDIPEELSEEGYIFRFYFVGGNSKLDITDRLDYYVSFIDSDENDIIDRVEWIVPHLFTQAEFEVEADLTIINIQSYPTVGGNWNVRFTTTGTADLTITPVEGTTFGESQPDDLKFLELRCGDTILDPEYDGTSVIYRNYHCDETGHEISKVLTRGIHTLEFRFGNDVEYAHNQAENFQTELQKITSVGSSWTPVSFTNTYESPIVIATLEIGSGHDPADTSLSVRIRSVTSTECEIKAMTPDYLYGSGSVPSNNIVYLMVVEEGYWDSITGFPKIETGKFTTSTVVANNYGSVGNIVNLNAGWSGDAEFFSNVITDNDPGWIETWQSSAASRLNPPTVSDFACSMQSAEVTPQDDHGTETIHWVAIQRGTGTFQGYNWQAGRTADTIEEYTHDNLENHNLGATPVWGIADQLAMDGNNGGWMNWEDDPFTSTQIEPYVQEDKYQDSETGHSGEEVSYFIWDDVFYYAANQPPTTPTNIQCNGNDNCDIDINTGINLQASGSNDTDTITYYIEANLSHETITNDLESSTNQKLGSPESTSTVIFHDTSFENGNDATEGYQDDGYNDWDWGEQSPRTGSYGPHVDNADYDSTYTYTSTHDITSYDSCSISVWMKSDGTLEDSEYICLDYASTGSDWNQDSGYTNPLCLVGAAEDDNTFHEITLDIADTTGYTGFRWRFRADISAAREDAWVDDINVTCQLMTSPEEQSTDWTEYSDVNSNYVIVDEVRVNITVDSYNPEASLSNGNNYPDLELEIYDETGWVSIGNFNLPGTYSGYDETDYNFSLSTTNPTILNAWQSSSSQDIRIRGVNMDYVDATTIDEINYKNVWVTIDGNKWIEIGNHIEGDTLSWDTSSLEEQYCINLRANATDPTEYGGSGEFSDYYTKDSCLNIIRGLPWLNVTLDNPNPLIYDESNPLELFEYEIFVVNATVECFEGGSCGEVSGSIRYNDTLGEPSVLINTTEGATPFYVDGVEVPPLREDDYVYKDWNFSIENEITYASDVATNGTYFWVLSEQLLPTPNLAIYRYTSAGVYDGWSLDISSDFDAPEGLYCNTTHLIVSGNIAGADEDWVYVYDVHSTTPTELQSFNVENEVTVASDVVTDGTYYWVMSSGTNNDYVYRYTSDGNHDSWSFDAACAINPSCGDDPLLFVSDGMEFNGTHFFITEQGQTNSERVFWYDSDGNYILKNFTVYDTSPSVWGLALYSDSSNRYFYIVDYNKPYVFRYEENLTKTAANPISCGILNEGDKCQLNWTVNISSASYYKIDVNFSSSMYPNVENNETLNAHIKIGKISFAIQLPGQSWVPSSKKETESFTTEIEFNATSKTQSNVPPCVYDTNCAQQQDGTTPIFKFQNTGNKPEQWNISINETLPSYITLIGDTDPDPAGATTITTDWIVNSNIPEDGIVDVWLWANFTDASPGTIPIKVIHRSMPAS